MKIKILIPFIIIALLFSAWVPAQANWNPSTAATSTQAAGTVQLVVNNKTGESFNLVLKGPATYNWNLKPGKATFSVQPGKYKYTYKACGGTPKTGTVEVKKNNQTLVLAVCKQKNASAGGMVNIPIQNNTGGTVTLSLTGPATYRFTLATGRSTISVLKGTYTYTAWGCGGASASGTKNLKGKNLWTWFCI
jgi:hypothetical protein